MMKTLTKQEEKELTRKLFLIFKEADPTLQLGTCDRIVTGILLLFQNFLMNGDEKNTYKGTSDAIHCVLKQFLNIKDS